MKIALLALFFLLFAFSTQQLTTAAVLVRDVKGNAVVPGQEYRIVDANDHERGIQADQIADDTCPTTVIAGLDPKVVVFHNEGVKNVTTEEPLTIQFSQVSACANSYFWAVKANTSTEYTAVIGPPDNVINIDGPFIIKQAKGHESDYVYNLAFNVFNKYEHRLATQAFEGEEILVLKLCTDEGFNVQFILAEPPTPPPCPCPQLSAPYPKENHLSNNVCHGV